MMSEQDDARDFGERILKTAYPKARLLNFVRANQNLGGINTPVVVQHVFLADFGDGYTSEMTVQRSQTGGWTVYIPNPPDGLAKTLP
jgi:hypothetical protein